KNIFGIEESKKTINSFSNKLDFNAMNVIKGGNGEDDDFWPPKQILKITRFVLTLRFKYAFNLVMISSVPIELVIFSCDVETYMHEDG
ncbi:MAG: hypothetical protein KAQ75_16160, partial [Bacteroidales bacterium]|nr:hypothetical protein [Bacteroidales bacterium]